MAEPHDGPAPNVSVAFVVRAIGKLRGSGAKQEAQVELETCYLEEPPQVDATLSHAFARLGVFKDDLEIVEVLREEEEGEHSTRKPFSNLLMFVNHLLQWAQKKQSFKEAFKALKNCGRALGGMNTEGKLYVLADAQFLKPKGRDSMLLPSQGSAGTRSEVVDVTEDDSGLASGSMGWGPKRKRERGPVEAERNEFMKCAVFALTMRKEKEGGRSEFWIFSEKKEEGAGTRTGQVVLATLHCAMGAVLTWLFLNHPAELNRSVRWITSRCAGHRTEENEAVDGGKKKSQTERFDKMNMDQQRWQKVQWAPMYKAADPRSELPINDKQKQQAEAELNTWVVPTSPGKSRGRGATPKRSTMPKLPSNAASALDGFEENLTAAFQDAGLVEPRSVLPLRHRLFHAVYRDYEKAPGKGKDILKWFQRKESAINSVAGAKPQDSQRAFRELLNTATLADVPKEDTEAGTQVKEENNRLRATRLVQGPANNNLEKPNKQRQQRGNAKQEEVNSDDDHGAEGESQQKKTDQQEARAYQELSRAAGVDSPK